MSKLLDRVSQALSKKDLTLRTTEARAWMRQNVKDLSGSNPQRAVLQDKEAQQRAQKMAIGKMYFFYYDPKTKDTLPYFDRFPLVIPIEPYSDGFLGLNLHYLPIKTRLILLDKLYDTLNNDKFDDTTKMRINYRMLAGARKFKEFEPCLKRYLFEHLKSRIVNIQPEKWEIAVFLPTEKFVGASTRAVQKDSQDMIQGKMHQ